MRGPLPSGSFVESAEIDRWGQCMTRGQKYRVAKGFADCDGTVHPPDEEWYFVGSYYVPYDDALSVYVADDELNEWLIPLQWVWAKLPSPTTANRTVFRWRGEKFGQQIHLSSAVETTVSLQIECLRALAAYSF